MSKIPIEPRAAKILIVSARAGLLHYGIMIVATMAVSELFDESAFRQSLGGTTVQNESEDDFDELETQIDRDRKAAQAVKRKAE